MATLVFSGQRLRDAQARQRMTAQALAERSGRSISSVYSWRAGRARPGANELAAIAEALGVPLEALYVRVPADANEQANHAPSLSEVA